MVVKVFEDKFGQVVEKVFRSPFLGGFVEVTKFSDSSEFSFTFKMFWERVNNICKQKKFLHRAKLKGLATSLALVLYTTYTGHVDSGFPCKVASRKDYPARQRFLTLSSR